LKILHIDDHQLFAEGLALSLLASELACQVYSCINVQEALTTISQQPDLDLILIDLAMPEMDGISFIQMLAERKILIPTAVLSAIEEPWQIKKALEFGACGYLPKYWSTQQLQLALKNIQNGEIIVPEFMKESIEALAQPSSSSPRLQNAIAKGITSRQLEVLELIQSGYRNKQIADILCISESTVKSHVKALFQALYAENRFECVRFAEQSGLLESTPRQVMAQNNRCSI